MFGTFCAIFAGIFWLENRSSYLWGGMLILTLVTLVLASSIFNDHSRRSVSWNNRLQMLFVGLSARQKTVLILATIAAALCLPYVNDGLYKGTLTYWDALVRIGSTAILVGMLDFCIYYIGPFLCYIMLPKEKEEAMSEQPRRGYVFTKTRKVFLFSGVGTGVCSAVAYILGIELLASLGFIVSLVALAHLA